MRITNFGVALTDIGEQVNFNWETFGTPQIAALHTKVCAGPGVNTYAQAP